MPRPDLAPRKSPRQRRAAVTVEAILQAAAHILEDQRLEGFNTNRVAARAGVSIGSLYQYFPSKDAILAALIRQDWDAFAAALAGVVEEAAPLPLRAGVECLVAVAVAHQMERPRLARILDDAEVRLPLKAETIAVGQSIAGHVLTFLMRHASEFEARPLEVAAGDVMAMVRGMVDAAGATGDADGLAARASRAVIGYLGPIP